MVDEEVPGHEDACEEGEHDFEPVSESSPLGRKCVKCGLSAQTLGNYLDHEIPPP